MRYFLTSIFVSISLWILPVIAQAEDFTPEEFLGGVGAEAGYVEGLSLPFVIGSIINVFLSILGALLVALLVYGGYLWMLARGDAEQVKKAKEVIKDAVIGLIIVLAAYSIAHFVVIGIKSATFGEPPFGG